MLKKIIKINLYVDQGTIELITEDYTKHTIDATYNGKPNPGTYHAVRDPQTQKFRLTKPSGGTSNPETGYVFEWSSDIGTLEGVQEYMVEVFGGAGGKVGDAAGPGGGTGGQGSGGSQGAAKEATTEAAGDRPVPSATWQKIQNLPEHIRDFLVSRRGRNLKADDYERVLLIGMRLESEGITPEELFDCKRRSSAARDVAEFERSVELFLDVRRAKRAARAENIVLREFVGTCLFGLKDLYEKYQRYKIAVKASAVSPAIALAAWDAPTLFAELNRELPRHGFAGVAEFEEHIRLFEAAFRRETLSIAFDLLLKYEYMLTRAQAQFEHWNNAETVKLQQSLGGLRQPARELYRQAEKAEKAAAAALIDDFDQETFQSKQREAAETTRKADEMVIGAAPELAMIGWQDFPRPRLLRAKTPADVRVLMGRYIAEHIAAIRSARKLIEENPDRIYELDNLLDLSRKIRGIADDSIYHLIVRDRAAEIEAEKSVRDILLAVLAVALSVVSFGVGGAVGLVAAGAAFGISAYQALEEIQAYDEKSKFYVTQLLSEEPSIAWAVIGVVGAGLDAAAVVQALKVVGPAAKAFNTSGDLAKLQDAMKGLDERILRSVERAAAAKKQFETVVESLAATGGKLRVVIVPGGGEFVKLVAVAYYVIKRGFVSVEKFLLELHAQKLIKDLARLTPEELRTLKSAFQEALSQSSSGKLVYGEQVYAKLSETARAAFDPETVDQFAAYARALGRSEKEVVDSIESSAQKAKEMLEVRAAATKGGKFDPSEVDDVRRARHVRTTQYDPGVGDSGRLGENLTAAKRPKPGDGYQAHHIIPSNEGPQELRDLLKNHRLDINGEFNGIWLPTGRQTPNLSAEIKHEFLTGSREYFDRLTSILIRRPPLTKQQVVDKLRKIASYLDEGKLPPPNL